MDDLFSSVGQLVGINSGFEKKYASINEVTPFL